MVKFRHQETPSLGSNPEGDSVECLSSEFVDNVSREHVRISTVRASGHGATECVPMFDVIPTEFDPAEYVLPKVILGSDCGGVNRVRTSKIANRNPGRRLVDIAGNVFKSTVEAELFRSLE